MKRNTINLLVAVAVAMLATACDGAETARLAPPPVESSATSPSPSLSVSPSPTKTPSPKVTASPKPRNCLGAVEYNVRADAPGKSSVCIAVGGIVRVEHLGPGMLTVDPQEKVNCFYAAGRYPCRLTHTGTVRFTMAHPAKTWTLTVTVAQPYTPPKPSPACMKAGNFTVNAVEELGHVAQCVQVGSVMRVEGLGPNGLTAQPAAAVICEREQDTAECRFVKAGVTVEFTLGPEPEYHNLEVVVIA